MSFFPPKHMRLIILIELKKQHHRDLYAIKLQISAMNRNRARARMQQGGPTGLVCEVSLIILSNNIRHQPKTDIILIKELGNKRSKPLAEMLLPKSA